MSCRELLFVAILLVASAAQSAAPDKRPVLRELPGPGECGPLQNSVGPFDYRKAIGSDILRNVEINHFNADVQGLIRGQSSYIGGDLNYILRAFPNHHRALITLTRYAQREKTEKLQGLGYPVSCWFIRAIQLAPDDRDVYSIFAVHLHNFGRPADAVKQMQRALELGSDDANVLYNAGLLYFDVGDYGKSLEYAKKAYAAGFPLEGLRQKLTRAGKWQD